MTQLGPFLVLIGVAAVALASLGGAVAWYNEEARRIRRGLRRVLRGESHAEIIAYGRGRGAGFNFTSNTMAVAWDAGAWCLIYRMDELLGVELIVDNQVAARAFRGEPRRPLDVLDGAEKQVALRLVFDDPQYADFVLELWSAARASRRGPDAATAVEEGNRWLARVESVFRRKQGPVTRLASLPPPQAAPPVAAEAPQPPRPTPAPAPIPADPHQELPFDLDEDEDADDEAVGR
ncbi:hypothetical protein LJR219_002098 [Phenylobacterium sp. LjRoot219]|uniref:hypothetical protein n=1 Tax=Phenylobacterium sp. LjRoot219 TaxID=3342283 RepID=UPI003ECD5A4E